MPADLVLGAQWGDEGKGKITDVLSDRADLIVRFQGGNNAGHTIVVGDQVFKLHHIPSGVIRGKTAVIGNGCVVDPVVLLRELDDLAARDIRPDLRISDRAHVITAIHRALDGAEEAGRGGSKVGTTGRGIGPAYADKMSRQGIRMGDLLRPDRLRIRLTALVEMRNRTLQALGAEERFDAATVYEELKTLGERLAPHITDTVALVQDRYNAGARVLLEGAQGCFLDIDHGTWPYVTSSNTTAGGAVTGSGLPPSAIGRTFGVVKAYTTRVGAGPFPTELDIKTGAGKHLADKGHEVGTTTGRARRCGWLDLVMVRQAIGLSGITHIALTKLDVLNGLKEFQVADAYDIGGEKVSRFPSDPDDFARADPLYTTFEGWDGLPPAAEVRGLPDLPDTTQTYLRHITKTLGVPYALVSTGPARDQTLLLNGP